MSKKILSLALALVMCLGLTVPASAAGTVKVVENEEHGVKATMNSFLREETHRYHVYDDFKRQMITQEFTIYVVEDNSTVTLEALEGRKYADAILQGVNRWTSGSLDRNSPEYAAIQAFWDNEKSYAYDDGRSWFWDSGSKCVRAGDGPSWPLEKAVTYTVSPSEDSYAYLALGYGIAWMCESDYAKLVPVDDGQSFQPTDPGQPTVSTVGGFSDVPANEYYADPVLWAVGQGITVGTGDSTFSPEDTCTNIQIITFLWRAAGRQGSDVTAPVSANLGGVEDYVKAANWAYENGIIGADFNPDAPCTRADTVNYMWKYDGSNMDVPASSFTDIPAGADYKTAVDWAVAEKVTEGTDPGVFSPDETCTRGQIVTFLYRGLAT